MSDNPKPYKKTNNNRKRNWQHAIGNYDNDNDHLFEDEEVDIQFEGDVASDATNSPPPRGQRQVTTRAAAYDSDGDVSTDDDSEHEYDEVND